jgi:hypothetical protein
MLKFLLGKHKSQEATYIKFFKSVSKRLKILDFSRGIAEGVLFSGTAVFNVESVDRF